MIKEYKKISVACVLIWTIFAVVSIYIASMFKINLYIWIIYSYLMNEIVLRYAKGKLFLCCNKIKTKYKKDFDIEYAINTYEGILSEKHLVAKYHVLHSYVILLLETQKLEKFVGVYQRNRKMFRSLYMRSRLGELIMMISSLLEDRSEFQRRLFKQRFSKYHRKSGKLDEVKSYQRFRDKTIEILQLYEKEQYLKVIEEIDGMNELLPWDKLYFQSIKERSLFYLNHDYNIPEPELTKYLFVKQWDVLVRTGEEYSNESVLEIIEILKKDQRMCYVKFVLFSLLFGIVVLILL